MATAKEYRSNCWKSGTLLSAVLPAHEQVRAVTGNDRDAWNACAAELQKHLNDVAECLLYGPEQSIQAIMQQSLPRFRLHVGLLSTMHMYARTPVDRGIPVYRYMLGSPDLWNEYFADCANPLAQVSLATISAQLVEGVSLPKRLFGERNATGALLTPAPPAGIDPARRVVVPYKQSAAGVAGEVDGFATKYPWALIDTRSFPMIYSLVARNAHPLGFLQMRIVLDDRPEEHYTGPESEYLHIYDPSKSWVKDLAELVTIFNTEVLAPFLDRTLLLKDHHTHASEIGFCFPQPFRTAVGLAKGDRPWDAMNYKDSLWNQEIANLHALWDQPAFPPVELVNHIIDLLWSRDKKRLPPDAVERRSQAEALLYWTREYRDHLVHVIKVFLIGEKIIHELHRNVQAAADHLETTQAFGPAKKGLEAFELQWMWAATIHDYSLPYEMLPRLQESYWRQFVVAEDRSEDSDSGSSRDFEQMQFGLALADRILRQHLVVALWQVLHSQDNPQGKEPAAAYKDLHDIIQPETKKIIYPRYLSYFLQHGDHGIASALWFLQHTVIEKQEKQPTTTLRSPGTPDLDAAIAIARACYFHHLSLKRRKRKDGTLDNSFYFDGNLFGTFYEEPLCWLLVLADFLQDEGRAHSKESYEGGEKGWSKRPFGHVTGIEGNDGGLEIRVEYAWIRRLEVTAGDADSTPLGEDGCGQKPEIQCKRRKNEERTERDCQGQAMPGLCRDKEHDRTAWH